MVMAGMDLHEEEAAVGRVVQEAVVPDLGHGNHGRGSRVWKFLPVSPT